MIEIGAPGVPPLYWYQDAATGLIGWTSIAQCGAQFSTEAAAHAKVRHTVGYREMKISQHMFMGD